MDVLACLHRVPGFHHCDESTLAALVERGRVREYAPGDIIVREGDESRELYFLLSGRVRVTKKVGPESLTLVELGDGDFFGEVAAVSFEPRPAMASVTAVTPVSTLVITRETMAAMAEEHPAGAAMIYRILATILSDKLRTLDQAFVEMCVSRNEPERYSELRRLQERLYQEWGF